MQMPNSSRPVITVEDPDSRRLRPDGAVEDYIPNPLHSASSKSTSDAGGGSSKASSRKDDKSVENEIPEFASPLVLMIYGFTTFFNALLMTTFYSAGIFYYTPVLKMSLTWSSAANTIASLVGIYSSIFIGYYGDRVSTRWGKRKPLIALFFPIMAVSGMAIYYCPMQDRLGIQAWYLFCIVVYAMSSTCYNSVLGAWFIESCSSGSDYIKIAVVGNVTGAVGGILAVVCSSVLHIYGPPTIIATLGLGTSLVFVLHVFPSRIVSKASTQPPLLSSFRVLSRQTEYTTILKNKVFLTAAYSCCGEFLLYVCFMAFPGVKHFGQVLGFYTIYAIVGILGTVPVVLVMTWLISWRKWEKIKIYMGITLCFVAISVALFALYLPGLIAGDTVPDSAYLALFDMWMALIIICCFLFSGAMFAEGLIVRDLIRFDTYRTGLNRENLYQTALSVPAQIAAQIIAAIPLTIFTSTGFTQVANPDPNDDLLSKRYSWDYSSHFQICVYSTFLFGLGALYSWHLFYRYPLVQPVADKIESALNQRTAAQERLEAARHSDISSKPPSSKMEAGGAEEGGGGDDVSALSSGSVGIDGGLSSIADDQDEMLMNHFSVVELRALSVSQTSTTTGHSVELDRIRFYHRLNLYVVGPATLACLLAGLCVQLGSVSSQFQVLTVNLLCAATFFLLYEFLRVEPLTRVAETKGMDVLLKAKAAFRTISMHQETLKEMLERNGIEPEDREGKRESLAPVSVPSMSSSNAPQHSEGDAAAKVVRDYIRLYAAQAVLALLGILFATVIQGKQ